MNKLENAVLIEPASPSIHFFRYARIPSLGLPILGALLRRMGLRVKIFCEHLAPIDWDTVARADLVGISALTNLAPRAYEISRTVREMAARMHRDITVVMGGPHPTSLPEEALAQGVDFVVRGEGEKACERLVRGLRQGGGVDEIPGLSYRKGEEIRHNPGCLLTGDLDELPFPDFSLIQGAERMTCTPLQTSRGCPYDCEFCSVVPMYGRKVRQRSIEGVLEELKQTDPGKHVFLVDDNFSADPDRTQALMEAMRAAGIKREWSTQERVSVAKRPDLLQKMRQAGCVILYLGLESMNPEALDEWEKGQSPEDVEEAVSTIHAQGLWVHGMFVLGADADTPASVNKTIQFALRSGIDTAQFFVLTPPPGTRLYRRLNDAGRIFDHDWSHYDGQRVVHLPKRLSPWELQELSIEATRRFYNLRRAVSWGLRGRWKNAALAVYGRWLLGRWLRQQAPSLASLKEAGQGDSPCR
ncbi:MAG: radical SAM protein [Candidatus Bipolaricaulota bacterium]